MSAEAEDELVPRETVAALRGYLSLVERWNRRINLLSRSDPSDHWRRHILDSAQLVPLAPKPWRSWLDLGSGAGFPGLVCAAIAAAEGYPASFTLIEADRRKAAFLREAARHLDLDVTVLNERIEAADLPAQDIISARALAPLDRLLGYAERYAHSGTTMLFPKGRGSESELTLARRAWHTRLVRIPSVTDADGIIFRISEARRRS